MSITSGVLRRLAGGLALAAAIAAALPAAAAAASVKAGIDHDIDAVWTAEHTGQKLIGMCVAVVDGTTNETRCEGRRGPDATTPPDASTLFSVGSISKVFASTLLAVDIQKHKVTLSQPASTLFPLSDLIAGVPLEQQLPKAVDLRALAQHYAGLPKTPMTLPFNPVYTVDELYSDIVDCYAGNPPAPSCPPANVPSDAFHYSNIGFGLLGDLLADAVDGYPRGQWGVLGYGFDVYKQVLEPLGMTGSGTRSYLENHYPPFDLFRAHGTAKNAAGSLLFGEPTPTPNLPVEDGAGGIWSNANDMLKFMRYSMGLGTTGGALLGAHHLLYDDTAHLRFVGKRNSTTREDIGLGWQIIAQKLGSGKTVSCVHKGGDLDGFNAEVMFRKNMAQQGVVVLLNVDPGGARDIAVKILDGLPKPAGASKTPTPCPNWTADIGSLN
jgi:CubicO group peptidase (beta-lactamase class C family)